MMPILRVMVSILAAAGGGSLAGAAGIPAEELEDVTVTGQQLQGTARSASQGVVDAEQLRNRPLLRPGELLEIVPGLIVTQHSGDGKANQFFLRGFNLDHGTDFATRVEGLPVNMPTHAHGQGYSDINFLIPELVERMSYRKGTYYAEEGNFSAAGAVDISYRRQLDDALVLVSGGEHDYWRAVTAVSPRLAGGDFLLAFEGSHADGPWELPANSRKLNGVAKYTRGDQQRGFTVAAMAYDGKWRSTDQIPLRAVVEGTIGRFGFVNASDGGETRRLSVSGAAWNDVGPGRWQAAAYFIDYRLDLFSDFTYFLNRNQGDQFEQFDDRRIYGGDAGYVLPLPVFGREGELRGGLQIRHDDIAPVGLYLTDERVRYDVVREDAVRQTSYSAHLSHETHWTPWLRTTLGVRLDEYRFKVDSNLAQNSGHAGSDIVSPKVAVTMGPWARSEYFLNWGRGFHSNDARGTTISVDPANGVTPATPVTPLVRVDGAEVGMRSAVLPGLQLAASVWALELDSELLFVGDGGATEASRSSRRSGVELSAYYSPFSRLILDADVALTRARFTDDDPAGNRIPNAVERVLSVGAAYHDEQGFFGGARLRYLGPGALIEDNSARSRAMTLLNLNFGYHFNQRFRASLSLLNALNERGNDITYFYESQLPAEAAPVSDVHFHPAEPRQLRLAFEARL